MVLLIYQKWLTKEIKVFELKDIALDHNSVYDTNISKICKTANAKVQSLNRVKSTLDKRTT